MHTHCKVGSQVSTRWIKIEVGFRALIDLFSYQPTLLSCRHRERNDGIFSGDRTSYILLREAPFWRIAMKAFILACVATVVIAAAGVAVLDTVQQPVAEAFATTGVRL